MPGFLDLPPELARYIAPYLHREDMNSIRLTCRQTNQHFLDDWVRAHLADICVLPTADALEKLHEICKDDKIRRAVRRIVIPGTIYRHIETWGPTVDSSALRCKDQPAEQVTTSGPFEYAPYMWQRCVNEYVQYLRSGALSLMLRRVLRAFSGIEISVLYVPSKQEEDITVWGRSDLVKRTGLDPWRRRADEGGWYFAEPTPETLIASDVLDICSSLSVTNLTFQNIEPQYMKALNMSHGEIEKCFVGLRKLHIELPSGPSRPANDERFYKFLNALSNLEDLNFCFSGYEDRPFSLFCDVAVPSLVVLQLESAIRPFQRSDLADLAKFLSHSAQTLRSLSLENFWVDLEIDERLYATDRKEKQAWTNFLRQLRNEFSLEKLFINERPEFDYPDSGMSVLSIFGDGREPKHQQSAEIIKTQLDECIKHFESAPHIRPFGE